MTFQVGLVGSDGVVIASDRRIIDYGGEGSRGLSLGTKFMHSSSVVCCWSGGYPAIDAAKYIREVQWTDVHERDRGEKLRDCGNRAWSDGNYGTRSPQGAHTILAAFPDHGSLWELDVGIRSGTTPVLDKKMHGDHDNTARHLVNHYFRAAQKIEHLALLAAHVVLMAGRENKTYVDGLEVVILPRGASALFLSPEQETQLEALSDSVHIELSKQLLQPFDFRPVTPRRDPRE